MDELDDEATAGAEDKARAWRRRFGLAGEVAAAGLEGLTESVAEGPSAAMMPGVLSRDFRAEPPSSVAGGEGIIEGIAGSGAGAPADRIALAREEMRRIVHERLGGDPALLDAIDELSLTGEEAVKLLEDRGPPPSGDQFAALEAIVAFDGTRPSFLLKEDRIEFGSTFSVGPWESTLSPWEDMLGDFAACVGRVELGTSHIGTAFLIAPTLALTNRHVAQSIADLGTDPPELLGSAALDFGREFGGRASHDRREIKAVLFAGKDEIAKPIDHAKLDLALLEVAPSALSGPIADRHLPISRRTGDLPSGWLVGAVGYPAAWEDYVPAALRTQYEDVLARLLAGDGGTKRFAPGETAGMLDSSPRWTATHDATTLNGNSGSPMVLLRPGPPKVTGLHYGGQWGGERTNWSHILANCGDALCVPGGVTLREALAGHGITI